MLVPPATAIDCGGAVGQVHRGGPDSDGSSAKPLGRQQSGGSDGFLVGLV